MYPTDRHYSKDHEWIQVDGETATIGITEFAQSELGDIVYVELPEKGKQVQQGDVLGTIESVKAVSEIYAPLTGTVAETNEALDDRPEAVNADAHGEGWYCKMTIGEPGEVDALMDATAYEESVSS